MFHTFIYRSYIGYRFRLSSKALCSVFCSKTLRSYVSRTHRACKPKPCLNTNSFLNKIQTVTLTAYRQCAELVTASILLRLLTLRKTTQNCAKQSEHVQKNCTFSIKKIDFFFYYAYIVDMYNKIVLKGKDNERT